MLHCICVSSRASFPTQAGERVTITLVMEKVEIAIRVVGVLYALGMLLLILELQDRDISASMAATVYERAAAAAACKDD